MAEGLKSGSGDRKLRSELILCSHDTCRGKFRSSAPQVLDLSNNDLVDNLLPAWHDALEKQIAAETRSFGEPIGLENFESDSKSINSERALAVCAWEIDSFRRRQSFERNGSRIHDGSE